MAKSEPRIGRVMLIDDSEPDNYFHRLMFDRSGLAGEVLEYQYADEALEFLRSNDKAIDLILLDINMPRMDGFEFIEEYDKLPDDRKAEVVVIMLSTSLNPEDKQRAESSRAIAKFLNKPISQETIREIAGQYFSNK